VTVTIEDDMVVEQQFENFFLDLKTYDSAVKLSPRTTIITIEDDDGKLTPQCKLAHGCVKISMFTFTRFLLQWLQMVL